MRKLNSNFSKFRCAHLHRALNSLYRLSPHMSDRCATGMRARSVDFDKQCHVTPFLSYPREGGLRVIPSAALYILSMTPSVCHSVKFSQPLLTRAFLTTSTYSAKHHMSRCLQCLENPYQSRYCSSHASLLVAFSLFSVCSDLRC